MKNLLRRATILSLAIFYLTTAQIAHALDGIPSSLKFSDKTLILNGTGERTKFFITVYNTGLYLEQKSSDAVFIINSDKPMAIRMKVISKYATVEKVKSALLDGFSDATEENTAPIQTEIDQFIADGFAEKIVEGDIFEFIYTPKQGVKTNKNGEQKSIIKGLSFKQALFGIWLSEDPAQYSLKEELLGK